MKSFIGIFHKILSTNENGSSLGHVFNDQYGSDHWNANSLGNTSFLVHG